MTIPLSIPQHERSHIVIPGGARAARRRFPVALHPRPRAVVVLVCAYLFYSSITYATSRSAIHVSLLVMGVGVAAWALTRMRARAR